MVNNKDELSFSMKTKCRKMSTVLDRASRRIEAKTRSKKFVYLCNVVRDRVYNKGLFRTDEYINLSDGTYKWSYSLEYLEDNNWFFNIRAYKI